MILSMKSKQFILLLIVWLLCSMPVSAVRFHNIHIDGASTVCSFVQDKYGIIWIGTENGLYSYDGYMCYPKFSSHTRNNTRIHSMLMADRNVIILGTENGIMEYNIEKDKYTYLGNGNLKDVRAIARMGNKIILGASNGVYVLDVKTRKISDLGIHHTVYSLLNTKEGLLAGTLNGLFIAEKGKIRRIVLPGERQPLVNSLLFDKRRHTVWIGCEGALYNSNLKQHLPIPLLAGNSVKAMTFDKDNNLLIGTDNGLYVYSTLGKAERMIHDARDNYSLSNNIVWSVFRDRWNNIWAGTDNGLSMYYGSSYYSYISIADITQSGEGNCLHNIFRDRMDRMWLGGTNGLLCYRNIGSSYNDILWYRQNSAKTPLSHNRIRNIYEDCDGDIWVATDHGINWFDNSIGKFRNFIITDKTGKYSCSWAYDILLDNKHRLWVAAYMGGIFIIDKKRLLASNGIITADFHLDDAKGRLGSIHIGQMAMDSNGYVWAMAYGKSIDAIDTKTFKVISRTTDKSINYLTSDRKGRIWAGYDGGVIMFTSPKSKPIEHDFHDNMPSSRIISLIDVGGNIWAIGEDICRIINLDGRDIHFKIPVINAITAYYSIKEKMVYIGGNDGFVTINPRAVSNYKSNKQLWLSSLLVNGKEYCSENNSVSLLHDIVLNHDENNLTFRLSDLPYDNIPQAIYAYKLEGSDADWQYLKGGNAEISYNALPYGKYTLLVKNIDSANADIYKLDININAPWYLSIWAKLIYLIIIILAVRWVMHFYAVKKNLQQEQLARRRIMEQSEARVRFFVHLSNEIKKSLVHIISPIYALLDNGNEDNRQMEEIRNHSVALNALIFNSLDYDGASSEDETVKPELSAVDIVRYMKYTVNDIKNKYSHAIKLDSDVSSLTTEIDIVRWDIAVNSLLAFIIRHSKEDSETVVTLHSDIADKRMEVVMSDRNMNIKDPERQFVFQKYGPDSNDADNISSGLFIAKKYIEMHRGSISLEKTAIGTFVFKISLPLDNAASVNSSSDSNTEDRLFSKAMAAIEEHISDSDFNVTSLQTELGVGNKLLYRKIKQVTGMTPVEYIRDIRMKKAALLLREGKFTVSEVMFMVGFSNSGYFSKCFQRTFGMTPTEYSKKTK